MKCPRCGATEINRNGRRKGRQNFICKVCKRQFLEVQTTRGYSEDAKQICVRLHQSGMGFRAIERATGISHNTVINWVRETTSLRCEVQEGLEDSEESLNETTLESKRVS